MAGIPVVGQSYPNMHDYTTDRLLTGLSICRRDTNYPTTIGRATNILGYSYWKRQYPYPSTKINAPARYRHTAPTCTTCGSMLQSSSPRPHLIAEEQFPPCPQAPSVPTLWGTTATSGYRKRGSDGEQLSAQGATTCIMCGMRACLQARRAGQLGGDESRRVEKLF